MDREGNRISNHDIGQRIFKMGYWKRAIPYFEEAIRENPQDFRAYNDLAYIHAEKLSDMEKALEYSKQALEYIPDGSSQYAAIMDTLGWCYYLSGDLNKAKEFLEKGVDQGNDTDDYFIMHLYHLLLVYITVKDIENANEIYERIEHRNTVTIHAIEAKQLSKKAMEGMLREMKWTTKLRKIIGVFWQWDKNTNAETVHELETDEKGQNQELAEEYFFIGQTLARVNKDWQGALSHFDEAIRLNPADCRAYEEAAYWLVDKLDSPQKALDYAQKVMELISEDTNSEYYVAGLDTLGWCYCKLGRVQEAKECLEKAARSENSLSDFLVLRIYHLLEVYEKLEDIQSAKELYRKIENRSFPKEEWITYEAWRKSQEIYKKILQLERQIELKKINEFAKIWNPLCSFENKRAPSNKIKEAIKMIEVNRDKAKTKLTELATEYPLDPILIHNLAVMNYWEIETEKISGHVLGDFIGYWVGLMYFDSFWIDWKKEREQFYFKESIEVEEIDDLRRFLWEMLEDKVPNGFKGYLVRETKTIETLKNLNDWANSKGLDYPVSLTYGPLMLKKFGLVKKFREMAIWGVTKFPGHDGFINLMLYLSNFGIATALLEEERIYDVFNALDKVESNEIPQEFINKFVNSIDDILQNRNSLEKVEILQKAHNKIKDETLEWIMSKTAKEINLVAIGKATKDRENIIVLKECQMELEGALTLDPGNELIKKNIEDMKHEIALMINAKAVESANKNLGNLTILEKCKTEFEEALSLYPENEMIKKNIETMSSNIEPLKKFGKGILDILSKARESRSSDQWDVSIGHYKRALREANLKNLSNSTIKEIKHELALVINTKAVESANKNLDNLTILEKCKTEFEEALSLYSENEMIKKNIETMSSNIEPLKKFGKGILDILSKARESRSDQWDVSIGHYKRALREAESKSLSNSTIKDIEHELALVINAKAVESANKNPRNLSVQEKSRDEVEEAHMLYPEDVTIKENLETFKANIRNIKYNNSSSSYFDEEALQRIIRGSKRWWE